MAPSKTDPADSKSPTSEVPDTLQEALRALSVRAAADALEFTHKLNAMRDRFDGTAMAGGDSSEVSDAPRRQPGELLYEAAKMHLQIANEMMTFGQRQADFWLDRVQRFGVSMLPREQRPPVRLTCEKLTADAQNKPLLAWTLFVFNAAHEPRLVSLQGRWRSPVEDVACRLRFNLDTPQGDARDELTVMVPARAQREIPMYHAWDDKFTGVDSIVADVEAFMQGSTVASTGGLSIGRMELVYTAKGARP